MSQYLPFMNFVSCVCACVFVAYLCVCMSVRVCRKVFLGYKKTNPCRKYAIKVMKKEVMINKNMASQGTWASVFFCSLLNCAFFICKYLHNVHKIHLVSVVIHWICRANMTACDPNPLGAPLNKLTYCVDLASFKPTISQCEQCHSRFGNFTSFSIEFLFSTYFALVSILENRNSNWNCKNSTTRMTTIRTEKWWVWSLPDPLGAILNKLTYCVHRQTIYSYIRDIYLVWAVEWKTQAAVWGDDMSASCTVKSSTDNGSWMVTLLCATITWCQSAAGCEIVNEWVSE